MTDPVYLGDVLSGAARLYVRATALAVGAYVEVEPGTEGSYQVDIVEFDAMAGWQKTGEAYVVKGEPRAPAEGLPGP